MASARSQMSLVSFSTYFRVGVTGDAGADAVFSTPHSPGVGSLLSVLPSLKGQVVELSAATRTHLEELLLEGDLLEVSLDQTFLIHRVLQAASVPPRETLHTLIQVRSSTRSSVQSTISVINRQWVQAFICLCHTD